MVSGGVATRPCDHGAGRGSVSYVTIDDTVHVITAGQDGRIQMWNKDGTRLRASDPDESDGAFHCLAVSPEGDFVAAGTDNSVQVSLHLHLYPAREAVWLLL